MPGRIAVYLTPLGSYVASYYLSRAPREYTALASMCSECSSGSRRVITLTSLHDYTETLLLHFHFHIHFHIHVSIA